MWRYSMAQLTDLLLFNCVLGAALSMHRFQQVECKIFKDFF